jgi:hypothetical protein
LGKGKEVTKDVAAMLLDITQEPNNRQREFLLTLLILMILMLILLKPCASSTDYDFKKLL